MPPTRRVPPPEFVEIADTIANHAAMNARAQGAPGGVLSVLDHPHRSGLSSALEEDPTGMLHQLHVSLRPVAWEYDFAKIHIGTRQDVPGINMISLWHDNLQRPVE